VGKPPARASDLPDPSEPQPVEGPAPEAVEALRREILEKLYGLYIQKPAAQGIWQANHSDPDRLPRMREAEYLRDHGLVKGQTGADGGLQLKLTSAGCDHYEAKYMSPPLDEISARLTNGEEASDFERFAVPALPTIVSSGAETYETLVDDGVDVLVVTATPVERDAVLRHMTPLEGQAAIIKVPLKNLTYFVGRLGEPVAALVMTRIGASMRDGSTLAVNEAIDSCAPRAVIAVGIAWGMDTRQLRLGDVLVSTRIVPFDVARRQDGGDVHRAATPEAGGLLLNRFLNVTGWSFVRPDGQTCRTKDGPVLSGESLVDSLAFKRKLHDDHPTAIGGEMEGTGIYGASARNRGEWIIVKAVCDWGDGTKDKRAQPFAAAASASLVVHVLGERGTLGDLQRMGRSSQPRVKISLKSPRDEKLTAKRAEVARDALGVALEFLDGLTSITSIFMTTAPNPADPKGVAEAKARWAGFSATHNRFVDVKRKVEINLPELDELFERVWQERAEIKSAQATYFATPGTSAHEFFDKGWGSGPKKRLASLREECLRVLRPIAQQG
jgi:nucleoside phosphorylase